MKTVRRFFLLAVLVSATVVISPGIGQARPVENLLVVKTVPRLAGISFSIDGRIFRSGANGLARITARVGAHDLSVESRVASAGARIVFDRWSDGDLRSSRPIVLHGTATLQAGFNVSYPTHVVFTTPAGEPVERARVASYSLRSSLGSRLDVVTSDPRRLQASYVVRSGRGLEAREVVYYVESVTVAGSNVVNRSQQRFELRPRSRWRIELLLFDTTFIVRDAVFGSPVGSRLLLRFPDGTVRRYPLDAGTARVVVRSLPRGDYTATAEGSGLSLPVPVVVSRAGEVLRLTFVSYVDIALLGSLVAFSVVALFVIGLRRRRRVREVASGSDSDPRAEREEIVSDVR